MPPTCFQMWGSYRHIDWLRVFLVGGHQGPAVLNNIAVRVIEPELARFGIRSVWPTHSSSACDWRQPPSRTRKHAWWASTRHPHALDSCKNHGLLNYINAKEFEGLDVSWSQTKRPAWIASQWIPVSPRCSTIASCTRYEVMHYGTEYIK